MTTTHQFTYKVTVYANTLAEAEQVMAERLDCDEDYGFIYSIDWSWL